MKWIRFPPSLPNYVGCVINKKWKFDKDVAQRFQDEAEMHIPDYHSVIDLSFSILDNANKENTTVLDIGSALGFTVNYFNERGFTKVYGVEKSSSMIERSKCPDRIFHSAVVPKHIKWDAVIANWTLHFINEREEYLLDIANAMEPGGTLILTDKMESSPLVEELYHDFKRLNGLSDDEINAKKLALENVLIPKPLEWYISTLKRIGFENIQVVNSRFMFYTICATRTF